MYAIPFHIIIEVTARFNGACVIKPGKIREFSSDFRRNEDIMKKQKVKKRRVGLWIALAVTACLLVFAGIMAVNAVTLRLKRATVYIEDLPPAFEGKTILYAADLDL